LLRISYEAIDKMVMITIALSQIDYDTLDVRKK